MAPTDRVWTGDTEIVFETARGYEWFVAELVECFGDFGISDLREIWHRPDDDLPFIELVFRHDDEIHHCWMQRRNDFLDPHLLDVFNAVIGGTRRFVWNNTGGGVEVRLVETGP
jgi:hypothetical protein